MQEIAARSKGTNAEGAEGAAGDAVALGRTLLARVVDKQAAAAVVAVASGVVAAAQLGLVLGVAVGDMELMQTMGELAALSILAAARCRVAGTEFRLVAGGADPRDEGGRGGLDEGQESLCQGDPLAAIQLLAGEQVVYHLLILLGGQH